MKTKNLIILAILPFMTSSCIVSTQKFMKEQKAKEAAITTRDSLARLIGSVQTEMEQMKVNIGMANKERDKVKEQLEGLAKERKSLADEIEKLKQDTLRLRKGVKNIETKAMANLSQRDKLTAQNEELAAQLEAREKELTEKLEAREKELNAQLDARDKELNAREETIKELRGVINDQNEKVQGILNNVKSALTSFSSDELTVREQGGKVYVAMSNKLLFQSGKTDVNQKGKDALEKVAEVLNKQSDVDIIIEGHTDSIPMKSASIKDNWDLSVLRATSVVRILTNTYGVNPLQIQPCGRGEHKPLTSNKTEEGRARNRRTEIIIAPKLDKLFELVSKK